MANSIRKTNFSFITRTGSPEKIAALIRKALRYEELEVSYSAIRKPPSSRAERLGEAQAMVEDAIGVVSELSDELDSWLSNLPENLQGSMKADQLQEAIDAHDSIEDALNGADWSVDFPGMMG